MTVRTDASTKSRTIDSTSRPTYPTSVYFVASTLTNGAPTNPAKRRAISVLPTPVGPIIKMFFGVISSRRSSRHARAPVTIAQRDGDGAFGLGLADDVLVEFGNDLPRRQRCGVGTGDRSVHVSISTMMSSLV